MLDDRYEVRLENIFEGPMDLLVYLIQKNEVDVHDIPIALITDGMPAVFIANLALRRIGGQTGDVLGAVQLASETTGWLMAAAMLATLPG